MSKLRAFALVILSSPLFTASALAEYNPQLGRFLQRDPNETAMPVMTAMAMNAETGSILLGSLEPADLYRDGLNRYAFVHSNPVTGSDPLGLYGIFDEHDPFEPIGGSPATYTTGTFDSGVVGRGLGIISDFFNGVSVRQILVGFAVEEAFNWAGGKGFDLTLKTLGKLLAKPTIKGIAAATRQIAKTSTWLSKGQKNVYVYIGYRGDTPVYVGVTNNLRRRATEHGERFTSLRYLSREPVTRNQAQAIEQAMIEKHPEFENIRNSISPRRDVYDEALLWGQQWLSAHGF